MSSFNLFPNTNAAAGSNTQGTTSNPINLFARPNTTQPAGGLATNSASSNPPAPAGPSLFGFGNTTGTTNNATSGASTTATPAGNNLFGNATSTPAPSGGLFGGATATPASTSTSSTAPAATTGGLFGGFAQSKPADQNAPKPATSSFFAPPNAGAGAGASSTPAPSLFGSTSAAGSAAPAGASGSAPATTATPAAGGSLFGGGLFGKKPDTPAASNTNAAATGSVAGATGTTPSLFGSTSNATATPAAGTSATTSTTTPSLFGTTPASTNKPEEKKDGAAPASAFNLFGSTNAAKPGEKKDETPKPSTTAATTGATTSTVQVSVPAPSMLRGKSVEEIVNKWTSELEEHVKEFTAYATDVAVWDRALVESGNNLSALYATLLAAEREQNDVDQSLEHIEQQQRDLGATLDAYEKATDEILGSSHVPSQGGSGGLRSLDTGPADTERDRNYMLATELHGHLDDLSVSLTQMIESVNALTPTATSNLFSSTADSAVNTAQNGPSSDDPLTQIAQVLSNHLESLQWIDGAVREVEAKVVDVERRVRGAAGDPTAGLGSPRLSVGNVGLGGSTRGAGDYNARFGFSGR